MPEMSLRQYARHRGVASRTIQKAFHAGRIVALRRERGAIIVDSEDCDRRLGAIDEEAREDGEARAQAEGAAGRAFSTARAIREHYRARLRQLEHGERTGALVSVDAVRVSAFNSARLARDALRGIADRVAPQVPGLTIDQVRALLRSEVEAVCRGFTGERTD